MCGIAGFIDTERSRDSAERLIDRMCQVIRHRGPDDQGVWICDGIALGMSRLSIIDLAGGHQPVFNEDGSILVVFNGEIYNYQELKSELETRAPLLDQYLVEYVASIPSTIRTHGGELKHLLKKVAAGMLPEAIVTRPKQGFGVPIGEWLRAGLASYARELLDSPRALRRGIFNPQFIRHLLKSPAHPGLINHSEAIWALLCLELWFQTCMDHPATSLY